MKETYLSRDFRETAAQRFSSQAKELNAFFDARLNALLAENADASKEKQYPVSYTHLSRYGSAGITSCAARSVSTAPIGSTTPESTPPRNALLLLSPSARSGMEMIAPSGKF